MGRRGPGGLTGGRETGAKWESWVRGDSRDRTGCRGNRDNQDTQENRASLPPTSTSSNSAPTFCAIISRHCFRRWRPLPGVNPVQV